MVWVPVALSLVMLSGCSSSASNPQVRELHQEVSQLNQQMQHLTTQASALEIQGQLNSHSQQGAWLIPQANTPVALQTQLGPVARNWVLIWFTALSTASALTGRFSSAFIIPLAILSSLKGSRTSLLFTTRGITSSATSKVVKRS